MATRLETFKVPFISSEYAAMKLTESKEAFLQEIKNQIGTYGFESAYAVLRYLEKHAIKEMPQEIQDRVRKDLVTVRRELLEDHRNSSFFQYCD